MPREQVELAQAVQFSGSFVNLTVSLHFATSSTAKGDGSSKGDRFMKKTGLALKIAVIANAVLLVAVFVGCRALTYPYLSDIHPVMPDIYPGKLFPNIAPPPPPPPFPSIHYVPIKDFPPLPPCPPKNDESVPQS
jgi:hypothetical protein